MKTRKNIGVSTVKTPAARDVLPPRGIDKFNFALEFAQPLDAARRVGKSGQCLPPHLVGSKIISVLNEFIRFTSSPARSNPHKFIIEVV